MDKHLKKAATLILCLTLLFSCALPVLAQESDEPSVKLFYTDNALLRCSVLILCWYGNTGEDADWEHATVGNVPDVTLEYTDADGAAKTIRIAKDKILQEVYAMDSDTATGQCVPQLTVCLPMFSVYLPEDARVSVSAGAFLTAEGEAFPAVSATISDFRERTCIGLEGKTEVLDGNQTVEGKQMQLYAYVPDADIDPDIKAVWTQHLTLTDNGQPVEREYTLQGAGTHTICAAINPFLTASFTITTVSEREAYRINTWYWGRGLWKAPLLLLGGAITLPLFLIIGGPLAGLIPGYMLAGGLQTYEFFFKSLFRTELLTLQGYFHEDNAAIIAA